MIEDDVFTVLRAFLLDPVVLPAGTEVLRAQGNRVPQPRGPNYVMMTIASHTWQSSTYHQYRRDDEMNDVTRSTGVGIQLDFYGPSSSDFAQRFATLFRDEYACTAMAGTGVTPLYCDDGQQMPLVNGEQQYEQRWTIQTMLQVNPAVSTPMQFADRVAATIVKAD